MKKETKDLLQAELANTLKRRKPIKIDEPAKYEYPTYDARHDSSSPPHHTDAPNVGAVLSVVSNLKIGANGVSKKDEPATGANVNGADQAPTPAGALLTHGKPNFQIQRKVSRTTSSPSSAKENVHSAARLMEQNGGSRALAVDKLPVKQTISVPIVRDFVEPASYASNGDKWQNARTAEAVSNSSGDMQSPKLLQNAMKNVGRTGDSKAVPDPAGHSPVARSGGRYNKVTPIVLTSSTDTNNNSNYGKLINTPTTPKHSHDNTIKIVAEPSSPPVPSWIVSNRRAFYERIDDNSAVRSNSAVTSPRGQETRHVITVNSAPYNQSSAINSATPTTTIINPGHTPNGSYVAHVRVDGASANRTAPTTLVSAVPTPKLPVTRVVHSSYAQKTVTSFSKDLHSVPNHHPDMVAVTRTARQTPAMSAFDEVRFSIGPNADVVPKRK